MNNKIKFLIKFGIISLFGIIILWILGNVNPFGTVEPLNFVIINYDEINEHLVQVEIFNSKNKSIFNETYIVSPGDKIRSPKITSDKGLYLFKVILDEEIIETYEAKTGIEYASVDIWLYYYTHLNGGKTIPLFIGQAVY